MREAEIRWTQEGALRLRYQPAHDSTRRGNYYAWEGGTGFGMRLHRTGRRTWVCATTLTDRQTGKQIARFFSLGVVGTMTLKDARIAASEKLNAMHAGIDPREAEKLQARDHSKTNLARTTLGEALQYYVDNRNCAPSSKTVLASCLRKNLGDWMDKALLGIDSTMLQVRYREIIERVKARGNAFDRAYAELPAEKRLLRPANGYRNGIKTAHDAMEGFGRVYSYWITKHVGRLQQKGVLVPSCPTAALIDDLIPQPQRVRGLPAADLHQLLRNLPTYEGNALHPLLARLLLATGLRVGALLTCKPDFVQDDRIVIPADAERGKVRWNKRHLEHMAKIIPLTPIIEQLLQELAEVAPQYGDASTWLFPSRESRSGHMEEERAVTLGLRKHAKVRFTLHQLRHNVASAAEELGYSKAEIAELLGHSTGSVTDRYIDERVKRHREQLSAINAKLFTDQDFAASPASQRSTSDLSQPVRRPRAECFSGNLPAKIQR